jgi:hypothetical protein
VGALHGVYGMSHRHYTRCVDSADLLHDAKKVIDFAEHAGLLIGLQLESRQVGDATDVLVVQGHTFIRGKTRDLRAMRYYLAFVSALAGKL